VFRHFATKDDLLAAIVLDRIDALNMVGERLLGAADPGAALLEFLTVAAHQRQQLDLSFLQEAGELNPEVTRVRTQMFQTVHSLVERAHKQGSVRTDVTGADVILLMCAPNYVTSYLPDAPPDLWQRYLAIIFDGLRPEGAHPLPHPPPATP
jgi:AcrR family transcriptional regulator